MSCSKFVAPCAKCGDPRPKTYPCRSGLCVCCAQDTLNAWHRLAVCRICPALPMFHFELSQWLLDWPFCARGDRLYLPLAATLKWHRFCVLTARGSVFNRFRYYSNGLAGNISLTEDIIDRILSFLPSGPPSRAAAPPGLRPLSRVEIAAL